MSIILLRGFSHSGKDYIGHILCKNYGFTRFAFADSLKKIVADKFGCAISQLHSQEGKLLICENDEKKRTYRQILIDEALRLRNLDSDIFVKHCCNDIISEDARNIVITDWRYPNELDLIKSKLYKYKVFPVHVVRTKQDRSPVDDISEYHLNDRTTDWVLHNNVDDSIFSEIEKLIKFIEPKNEVGL